MKRKNKPREITNEEFQIALDSIDNQNIIHKVCGRFMGQLSSDTLKQCGLDGLWRALKSHDPSYQRKFTSSLYQFVEWECQRAMENLYADRLPAEALTPDIPADDSAEQATALVNELLEFLTPEHRDIVVDRYIYNYTLKEIGDKHGYTDEGIRYILKKALEQLREADVGV